MVLLNFKEGVKFKFDKISEFLLSLTPETERELDKYDE